MLSQVHMSDDAQATWGDHQWFQPNPRRLELESGVSVFQRRCTRCGRDFLIDRSSGVRYAVHASIFSFHRLHDEVTQRWLNERCPGKRLPSDESDRQKRAAELRLSWQQSRE
jgi:hypothetical protein